MTSTEFYGDDLRGVAWALVKDNQNLILAKPSIEATVPEITENSGNAPASAERAIRDAYNAIPSAYFKRWHPFTVTFNGVTQQFFGMVKKTPTYPNTKHSKLYLLNIRPSRLFADMAVIPIAQHYSLSGDNKLIESGLPFNVSGGMLEEWERAFGAVMKINAESSAINNVLVHSFENESIPGEETVSTNAEAVKGLLSDLVSSTGNAAQFWRELAKDSNTELRSEIIAAAEGYKFFPLEQSTVSQVINSLSSFANVSLPIVGLTMLSVYTAIVSWYPNTVLNVSATAKPHFRVENLQDTHSDAFSYYMNNIVDRSENGWHLSAATDLFNIVNSSQKLSINTITGNGLEVRKEFEKISQIFGNYPNLRSSILNGEVPYTGDDIYDRLIDALTIKLLTQQIDAQRKEETRIAKENGISNGDQVYRMVDGESVVAKVVEDAEEFFRLRIQTDTGQSKPASWSWQFQKVGETKNNPYYSAMLQAIETGNEISVQDLANEDYLKDSSGEPLIVYHGSNNHEISEFSVGDFFGSGLFGRGINFTSSFADASKYATTDVFVNLDLPGKAEAMAMSLGIPYERARGELTKGKGKVYKANLKMKNPLVIGDEKLVVSESIFRQASIEADYTDGIPKFYEKFNNAATGKDQFDLVYASKATRLYRQIASLQGNDGLIIQPVIAPKSKGATHYLVLDADQVSLLASPALANAKESNTSPIKAEYPAMEYSKLLARVRELKDFDTANLDHVVSILDVAMASGLENPEDLLEWFYLVDIQKKPLYAAMLRIYAEAEHSFRPYKEIAEKLLSIYNNINEYATEKARWLTFTNFATEKFEEVTIEQRLQLVLAEIRKNVMLSDPDDAYLFLHEWKVNIAINGGRVPYVAELLADGTHANRWPLEKVLKFEKEFNYQSDFEQIVPLVQSVVPMKNRAEFQPNLNGDDVDDEEFAPMQELELSGDDTTATTELPDVSYRDDGMFTQFLPNTKAGEAIFNAMAIETEGTGKVLSIHAAAVIQQIKDAGYSVQPASANADEIDTDALYAALFSDDANAKEVSGIGDDLLKAKVELPKPTKYRDGSENDPIELEIEQLNGLGVATITSCGSENIYIVKDGLNYYCKVGNTEDYLVGEWDFIGSHLGSTEKVIQKHSGDYRLYSVLITEKMSESGQIASFFKFAKIKNIDKFSGLPLVDQADLYGRFIADGNYPVQVPQNSNEWVQSQYDSVEARSAENEIPLAKLAEKRRAALGLPSYMDAHSFVATALGVGETESGELDISDEDFERMNTWINELMEGADSEIITARINDHLKSQLTVVDIQDKTNIETINSEVNPERLHDLAFLVKTISSRKGQDGSLNDLINQLGVVASEAWQKDIESQDPILANAYKNVFGSARTTMGDIFKDVQTQPQLSKNIYRIAGDSALVIISKFASQKNLKNTTDAWEATLDEWYAERDSGATSKYSLELESRLNGVNVKSGSDDGLVDESDNYEVLLADLAGVPEHLKFHVLIRNLLDDMTDLMNGEFDIPIDEGNNAIKAIELLESSIEDGEDLAASLEFAAEMVGEWLKVGDLESASMWRKILPQVQPVIAELKRLSVDNQEQSNSAVKAEPQLVASPVDDIPAWKLTQAEYVEQEFKKNEYFAEYQEHPKSADGIKADLAGEWQAKLKERAAVGKIDFNVLDDYVRLFGLESLRDFRGSTEKGVEGYTPTSSSAATAVATPIVNIPSPVVTDAAAPSDFAKCLEGKSFGEKLQLLAARYAKITTGKEQASDLHIKFATAFIQKDAKRLQYIANGANNKALMFFGELTGNTMPNNQADALAIINNWATPGTQAKPINVAEVIYKTSHVKTTEAKYAPDFWYENKFEYNHIENEWRPNFSHLDGLDYAQLRPFVDVLIKNQMLVEANLLRAMGTGEKELIEKANIVQGAWVGDTIDTFYALKINRELTKQLFIEDAKRAPDLLHWSIEQLCAPLKVTSNPDDFNDEEVGALLDRDDNGYFVSVKSGTGLIKLQASDKDELLNLITEDASELKEYRANRYSLTLPQLEVIERKAGADLNKFRVGKSIELFPTGVMLEYGYQEKNYVFVQNNGTVAELNWKQAESLQPLLKALEWDSKPYINGRAQHAEIVKALLANRDEDLMMPERSKSSSAMMV